MTWWLQRAMYHVRLILILLNILICICRTAILLTITALNIFNIHWLLSFTASLSSIILVHLLLLVIVMTAFFRFLRAPLVLLLLVLICIDLQHSILLSLGLPPCQAFLDLLLLKVEKFCCLQRSDVALHANFEDLLHGLLGQAAFT